MSSGLLNAPTLLYHRYNAVSVISKHNNSNRSIHFRRSYILSLVSSIILIEKILVIIDMNSLFLKTVLD